MLDWYVNDRVTGTVAFVVFEMTGEDCKLVETGMDLGPAKYVTEGTTLETGGGGTGWTTVTGLVCCTGRTTPIIVPPIIAPDGVRMVTSWPLPLVGEVLMALGCCLRT